MQLPNFLVSSSRFIPLFCCHHNGLYIPIYQLNIQSENKPKKPTQMIFFLKKKKAMHFLSQLKFLLLQFSSSFNWLRLYIIFIE